MKTMKSVSNDYKFSVTTKGAAMMLGVSAKTLEETLDLMRLIDKCRNEKNLFDYKEIYREYQSRKFHALHAIYNHGNDSTQKDNGF
jgi:hypothetical protein